MRSDLADGEGPRARRAAALRVRPRLRAGEDLRAPPDLRLGVDVGGTNTDAVVLDAEDRLLAKAKVPTTPDVTTRDRERDRRRRRRSGRPEPDHARDVRDDARDERGPRATRPAAASASCACGDWRRRRSGRCSGGLPTCAGGRLGRRRAIVHGGIEFDGRELSPLDTDGDRPFRWPRSPIERTRSRSRASFAPVSDEHERAAEEIVRKELGDLPISLSSQIGSLGSARNARTRTVLNASLIDVARGVDGRDRRGPRPRLACAPSRSSRRTTARSWTWSSRSASPC